MDFYDNYLFIKICVDLYFLHSPQRSGVLVHPHPSSRRVTLVGPSAPSSPGRVGPGEPKIVTNSSLLRRNPDFLRR